MSSNWSGEKDAVLIHFVRNHELLYNIKNKNYRKTQLKQKLWCDIGTILNKTDTDCCKRWCYIRDYYIRRKGKRGTGSSGEAARKRSDLLSFLDRHPSSQRHSSTDAVDENPGGGSEIVEDIKADAEENYSFQTQEPEDMTGTCNGVNNKDDNDKGVSNKDQRKKHFTNPDHRLNLLKEIAQQKSSSENELDETELFFSSMAKIVKKLPRYEQAQLRIQIGSLVGNAELRSISNDPVQSNELSRPEIVVCSPICYDSDTSDG